MANELLKQQIEGWKAELTKVSAQKTKIQTALQEVIVQENMLNGGIQFGEQQLRNDEAADKARAEVEAAEQNCVIQLGQEEPSTEATEEEAQ